MACSVLSNEEEHTNHCTRIPIAVHTNQPVSDPRITYVYLDYRLPPVIGVFISLCIISGICISSGPVNLC